MIFKQDDEISFMLIYKKETEEKNGVTIKVPIKYDDINEFANSAKEQLAYFENVYFDLFNFNSKENPHKIFRHELFQFSELITTPHMHLTMDDVYYPINFKELEIAPINVPIALRFNLSSGLVPLPNREQLEYSKTTKTIIKDRIKEVADWFVNKFNEEVVENDNIFDAIIKTQYRNTNISIAGKNFNVQNLEKYATKPLKTPCLKGFDTFYFETLYANRYYLFSNYEILGTLGSKYKKPETMTFNSFSSKTKAIFVNEFPQRTLRNYLTSVYGENTIVVRKKYDVLLEDKRGNGNFHSYGYKSLLKLKKFPKNIWRETILKYQQALSTALGNIKDATNVTIPQKWIEERKLFRKMNKMPSHSNYEGLNKEEGDVTIAYPVMKLSGKGYTFKKEAVKINSIQKNHYLTIVFEEEEKDFAEDFKCAVKGKVKVAIVGKKEQKKLPKYNFMTMNEFSKTNKFRKIVTAILFEEQLNKHKAIEKLKTEELLPYFQKYKEASSKLNAYVETYLKNHAVSTNFKNKLYSYFEENNQFDKEFWPEYLLLKEFNDNFEFLIYLHGNSELIQKTITSIFLLKKKYGWLEGYELVKKKEPKIEETV